MQYLYSEDEVKKMWQRSYDEQIDVAIAKCMEVINHTDGKCFVSFSGGKDSAVLLHLMAKCWKLLDRKETLLVLFSDTTNEFKGTREYVKRYVNWIETENDIKCKLEIVNPKNNYFEVISKYGYPFISKKVSKQIRTIKKELEQLGLKYSDISNLMPKRYTPSHYEEMKESANNLRKLGFSNTSVLLLTKITSKDTINQRNHLPIQYRPLLDFDVKLSEECCDYLKKKPIKFIYKKIKNLVPVTGEMACESKMRMDAYRKTGCNLLTGYRQKSKPLGPVTEQTILRYIYETKIPLNNPYGDVVCKNGEYRCTGEPRTGCRLCGFGIKFEPNRFVRLQQSEPDLIDFAFNAEWRRGLGYERICKFLNDNCKIAIKIPKYNKRFWLRGAVRFSKKRGQPLRLPKRRG